MNETVEEARGGLDCFSNVVVERFVIWTGICQLNRGPPQGVATTQLTERICDEIQRLGVLLNDLAIQSGKVEAV